MTLRPFRLPSDLKTLAEIIPPAFQYPDNDAWSMQPEEVESFVDSINGIRRLWPLMVAAAALSPSMRDVFRGFVWEEGGQMVGSANVLRQGASDRWYIGNVAVLPDYRRRGIARRLVEACMALARERGAKTIMLDVVAGNVPAVSLYERLGFEQFSGLAYLTLAAEHDLPPHALPEPVRLEVGSIFDWRPRYALAERITPPHVRQYAPVEEAAFRRPAALRMLGPVIRLATGMDNRGITVRDGVGEVIATGLIAARRRPGGINELSLMLDPGADELGPALVTAVAGAVRRISPGRRIDLTVPHWQEGLIAAALAVGFTRRLDEQTMGIHVMAG